MVTRPRPKDPLSQEILRLKEELNAVLLAHNYQIPEIQDLADYVGDSLGLARQAAETSAEVIVFCGVHFMAETAKILNPDKPVLLPDLEAGCSLEQSCPAEQLKAYQEAHRVFTRSRTSNCSAAVKALSDVICTSGNAVKIVESAPEGRDLLFVPDENLGAWVMEQTQRPMELWKGNCYAHVEFTADSILAIRENTRMPFWSLILNAHAPCACWQMKFVPLKKWSTSAEAAEPVPSLLPLKWVCFIGWRRSALTSNSSPHPPTTVPVMSADT